MAAAATLTPDEVNLILRATGRTSTTYEEIERLKGACLNPPSQSYEYKFSRSEADGITTERNVVQSLQEFLRAQLPADYSLHFPTIWAEIGRRIKPERMTIGEKNFIGLVCSLPKDEVVSVLVVTGNLNYTCKSDFWLRYGHSYRCWKIRLTLKFLPVTWVPTEQLLMAGGTKTYLPPQDSENGI